eukprot:scaffold221_cov191-Chaetoceros_neogracile.AAC.5
MGMKGFSSSSTKVPVQVSSNGQDYSTSTTFYSYSEQMKHISLYSLSFMMFGDKVINATHIECAVPPHWKSRVIKVCVSADEYLKLNDSQFTTLSYDVPLKVKDAYPLSGPSSGNFAVTINGGPFRNLTNLYCRFGSSVILATYVTSMQIQCLAPQQWSSGFQFRQTAKTFRVMSDQFLR